MARPAATARYCFGSTSLLPPYPHRILTVVPLIAHQRYYGEDTVGAAGGAGAGWEEQAARGSALGEPGWAWRGSATGRRRATTQGRRGSPSNAGILLIFGQYPAVFAGSGAESGAPAFLL